MVNKPGLSGQIVYQSLLWATIFLISSARVIAEPQRTKSNSFMTRAFMLDGRPPGQADCFQNPFASGCRGISAKRSSSGDQAQLESNVPQPITFPNQPILRQVDTRFIQPQLLFGSLQAHEQDIRQHQHKIHRFARA